MWCQVVVKQAPVGVKSGLRLAAKLPVGVTLTLSLTLTFSLTFVVRVKLGSPAGLGSG